jgi:hypothetical protein
MAHVRDVLNVDQLVAVEYKRPAQNVLEDICAEIAYVSKIVDGKTAAVQLDVWRIQRNELLFAPRHRVEEIHRHRPFGLLGLGFRLLYLRPPCADRFGFGDHNLLFQDDRGRWWSTSFEPPRLEPPAKLTAAAAAE